MIKRTNGIHPIAAAPVGGTHASPQTYTYITHVERLLRFIQNATCIKYLSLEADGLYRAAGRVPSGKYGEFSGAGFTLHYGPEVWEHICGNV